VKEEKEANGDDSTNIKPSTAKKQRKKQKEDKEKEKEKEESKEKEEVKKPKVQQAPTEDLLGDFNFTSTTQTGDNGASDDWLNGFAVDDKQFQNGGRGDDGGQFGFGSSDEQNDEPEKEKPNEEEPDNSDAWLTQVTGMDDPLQGVEKPQKKVNKKGKTMAQMQTKNDLAGKFDDNFLQSINSGLTGQPTSTQNNQSFNNDPFLFNNTTTTTTTNNSSGFYQPQPTNPTYTTTNDPFRGLAGQNAYTNNPNGPIPATYQKADKNDPFSTLSWK